MSALDDLIAETRDAIENFGHPEDPNSPKYFSCKAFNSLLETYNNTTDDIDRSVLFDRLVTLQAGIKYGGGDPKLVPTSVLKFTVANGPSDSRAEQSSRERIRNANTAIRAKCIGCMGGSVVDVRHCPSITCVLWPFRMGDNPFFGRLVATDTNAEVVEEEVNDADSEEV